MEESGALGRLQRLAKQADEVNVSAPPKARGGSRRFALPYLPRLPKHDQNTNRNAVLIFAAGMAVITWLLIQSVDHHLPTNSKEAHQWTDVTAHFHKYPHAEAASDPKAYLEAGRVRKETLQQTHADTQQQASVGAPKQESAGAQRLEPQPVKLAQIPRRQHEVAQPLQPMKVAQSPPKEEQEEKEAVDKKEDETEGEEEQEEEEQEEEDTQPKAAAPAVPQQQQQQQPTTAQVPANISAVADARKGGAPCSSGIDCGEHGGCVSGRCMCVVTYRGPACDQPIQIPAALQVEAEVMSNWTAQFDGEMVLNKRKMATRNNLMVHLPGKEDDPDHGFRELIGGGSELSQLNAMLPPDDTILKGAFFHKCAVIGSSGIVLNYEHGADIDQNDMVFRFNSAPTKGYEKFVGSKTTHRITNTQNWGYHEGPDENILIHFRAKSAIKGLFWNQKQKKKLAVYAFDPEFVEYMAFSLDFMATSGLYGIVLAMHRCAEVNLYGFQVSTAHGALYHYYDVCDVPANVERDDSEYNVVRAFAKAGLVNFREPCIIECHNSPEECTNCKTETGFVAKPLPSDKKCAPGRVSRGHLEVPWRRDRHKHGHGHGRM